MANPILLDSVHKAIENARTLTVKTVCYLPRERVHIDTILGAYLDAAGMHALRNKLGYCVHELAGNARKANTKRLYFREKGLDIEDAADYRAGMEGFKQEMLENVGFYQRQLREEGFYIKFQFRAVRSGVRVAVRNNAALTAAEAARIREKLAVARRCACLAEAYARIEDGSEGAGLGIVMMLFMLKNLGFGPEVFSIRTVGAETVAMLDIVPPRRAAIA